MSALGDIRDAVYEAIDAARDDLVINYFDLARTFYPKTELQALTTPRVFVVPLQWTEGTKLSRGNIRQSEYPIQVAVQAKVVPTNFEEIDTLIDLVDELYGVVADVDLTGYTWTSTRGSQDPNGTPLTFSELHEHHIFQSIFTATYIAAVC